MNFNMLKKTYKGLLKLGLKIFLKKNYVFGISIRLTDLCNLNCCYCGTNENQNSINIKLLINYLKYLKRKGLCYVILTGGEPFLYKDIDILMDFLIKQNLYIVINTNGTLIKNEVYKKFLLKGDEIVVSLDGNEKINDIHRGKGTFKNIIKTLDFLKKNRKKTILSTVLSKVSMTKRNFDFFISIKDKYGLILDMGMISNEGIVDSENVNKIIPDNIKIKSFIDYINKCKKIYNIKEISGSVLEYFINPISFNCKSVNFFQYINVDGNIYPCISKIGNNNYKYGNIKEKNKRFVCYKCDICSCQTLIVFNKFLSGKLDIKSLLRWFF